jgi:hypothetical protein
MAGKEQHEIKQVEGLDENEEVEELDVSDVDSEEQESDEGDADSEEEESDEGDADSEEEGYDEEEEEIYEIADDDEELEEPENIKEGYIYCLSNPIYIAEGENVYKLGKTDDIKAVLKEHKECYIRDSVIVHQSNLLRNACLAENILFTLLEKNRIEPNQEFYKCPSSIIIETIKNIETDMVNLDDQSLITKYQMKNRDIYKKKYTRNLKNEYNNYIEELITNIADNTVIDTDLVKKMLNCETLTKEIIDANRDKIKRFINYKMLENPEDIPRLFTTDDIELSDYMINKQRTSIEYITELVKMMGFDGIKDNKMIDSRTFTQNAHNVIKNSKLFNNPDITKDVFNIKIKMPELD